MNKVMRNLVGGAFFLIAGLILVSLTACSGSERSVDASIVFRGCREKAATPTPIQPRTFECAIYVGVLPESRTHTADPVPESARIAALTSISEFGTRASSPHWSSDGTRIAFVSGEAGHPTIALVNADGSQAVQLEVPLAAVFQPFWSPDGKRIAFMGEEDDDIDLYVIDADGTNLRRLTSGPEFDSFVIHPLADFGYDPWDPDGRHLAFTRFEVRDPAPGTWANRADVFVLDIEKDELQRIAELSTFVGWAPNGDWLLALATPAEDATIELVSMDGDERRLVSGPLPDGFIPAFSAAWSPDGQRVAFAAWRDSEPRDAIYIVNIDDPDARYQLIAESCLARQGLTWSSTGEWLAFVTGCNLDPAIGFVRNDGSGRITLELLSGGELVGSSAPDWLP